MKICRKMQRYSLWSGLIKSRQGFSQRFVFLSFFFLLENLYFGQDGKKWCDAPRRDVCGGCERASHATAGGPGVLPPEIFCKYKLWEGRFRANLKATGKKGFLQKLGKKSFCLKKGLKKVYKVSPGGLRNTYSYHKVKQHFQWFRTIQENIKLYNPC